VCRGCTVQYVCYRLLTQQSEIERYERQSIRQIVLTCTVWSSTLFTLASPCTLLIMALRYLFQAKAVLEARFQQFLFKNMFPAQLQLDYVGRLHNDHSADTNSSLLDSIWLAGPKSKVRAFSPTRLTPVTVAFLADFTWQEKRETSQVPSARKELASLRPMR
jgi:hypothetical protein